MRLHIFQFACIMSAIGPGIMPVPKDRNFWHQPPPFRMKRYAEYSTWRPKHPRNRKGRDPYGRSGYYS